MKYVIRGNVRTGKLHSGNYPSGKCPFEELSVRGTAFGELSFRKLSVGELTVGKMSLGNCPSGKSPLGKCPSWNCSNTYINTPKCQYQSKFRIILSLPHIRLNLNLYRKTHWKSWK